MKTVMTTLTLTLIFSTFDLPISYAEEGPAEVRRFRPFEEIKNDHIKKEEQILEASKKRLECLEKTEDIEEFNKCHES